jgi:hypothetical protein
VSCRNFYLQALLTYCCFLKAIANIIVYHSANFTHAGRRALRYTSYQASNTVSCSRVIYISFIYLVRG